MSATIPAPWETLAICLLLLLMPGLASPATVTTARRSAWHLPALVLALVATLFAPDGPLAYAAAAAAGVVHGRQVRTGSRTGAAALYLSAVLALGAAAAIGAGWLTSAFLLSTLLVAMRAGAMPFHAGVASLCDRVPLLQTEQLASTIALVFVHLRFVDHHAEAVVLAPAIVRYGAAATLAGALLSTVQRDLKGFYRSTTVMHGGMIVAALGAASLHNYAAALLVTVASALSVGGLGVMVASVEERLGIVSYSRANGAVHAFPRLAAAFAVFGAASVAMPGTAGFVADDLLLHALWMESPVGTVAVIVSSAMLAVSTLVCFTHVFLGRAATIHVAPDLVPRERVAVLALVLLLLLLGFSPGVLLYPADEFLERPPDVAGQVIGAARPGLRPL